MFCIFQGTPQAEIMLFMKQTNDSNFQGIALTGSGHTHRSVGPFWSGDGAWQMYAFTTGDQTAYVEYNYKPF